MRRDKNSTLRTDRNSTLGYGKLYAYSAKGGRYCSTDYFLPFVSTKGNVAFIALTTVSRDLMSNQEAEVIYFNSMQVLPITNYTMKGRTYRYFEGDPLFPFGYGMSYTEFDYTNLTILRSTIKPCDNNSVFVTVQNTGRLAGDEVCTVGNLFGNICINCKYVKYVFD